MVTIHTNTGSMVAQAAFRQVSTNLDMVSKRVNTGFKVAGAIDDASTFAVAQGLRGDVKSIEAVNSTLSRGVGVGEVALASAETVSNLVQDVKAKITQMSNDSLTATERAAYEADLVALTDQITNAIGQANFSGKNVLTEATNATFLADESGSNTISIRGQNIDAASVIMVGVAVGSVTGTGTGATAQAALTTFENAVNASLGQLGADVKGIQAQQELLTKRSDATEKGIGALVDADLAKESSKLQALQTQQQLAVQAISIANQGSGVLLSLFR
jgi:flagellin